MYGIMGKVTDNAGIHFKMLNLRKGPAVRGPRAQADRDLYKKEMQELLKSYPNLQIVEASVEDLILSSDITFNLSDNRNSVEGIRTKDGRDILAKNIVITTGTFIPGSRTVTGMSSSGAVFSTIGSRPNHHHLV